LAALSAATVRGEGTGRAAVPRGAVGLGAPLPVPGRAAGLAAVRGAVGLGAAEAAPGPGRGCGRGAVGRGAAELPGDAVLG
jgi:hypothetical protein